MNDQTIMMNNLEARDMKREETFKDLKPMPVMNITPEVMILKNDDAKFETVVAIEFGNKLIQQSFISDTVDGMVSILTDLVPDIAEHFNLKLVVEENLL